MKRIVLTIVIVSLALFTAKAQNVNIPDANFKNALLNYDPVIDTNNDGEIQLSEAQAVTGVISVDNRSIADLTGIEAFTNITVLSANQNIITVVDLSQNTALSIAYLNGNRLSSFNVSANTALTQISCNNNPITALNVINNTLLTELYASNTLITTLDISQNTLLESLNVDLNQLSSLDVSNNTALKNLVVNGNGLIAIDVSNNTALEYLNIASNQLTALNVSNNASLRDLRCGSNGITALDISNNTALTYLECPNTAITQLDLSSNTALTYLACHNSTNLAILDVSNNPALTLIDCSLTAISELNLSQNTALTSLYCRQTNLTTLDVSANTALTTLVCRENQLSNLNVANGNNTNFTFFWADTNPNLSCIQVDNATYSTNTWTSNSFKFDAGVSFSENCGGGKQNQTITFNELGSVNVGDANFALTASASSGLAVSFTSSDLNVATISGSTVSIVGAGTTTITASQAGDDTYNAATNVTRTLTVNKVAQTITFNALVNATIGDADFDLAATASSGLAVTYSSSDQNIATISGSTVTIVGSGTTTITASQAGNNQYEAAAEISQTLTVDKKDQTISFATIGDQLWENESATLEATASSGLEVGFTVVFGPAIVDGNTITFVGLGTVSVRAYQLGNQEYKEVFVDQSFEVTTELCSINQVNVIEQSACNPETNTYTLTAEIHFVNAPATGQLNINGQLFDYTTSPLTVTLTGLPATGADVQYDLFFTENPSCFYSTSGPSPASCSTKATQSIIFNTIEDQPITQGFVALGATASSGLEVTYEVISGPATISGNTATFTGLGAVRIKAMQAGNEAFLAATPVEQTFEVIAVTAVESEMEISVNFYPNPVTDELILTYNNHQIKDVQLFDLQGIVVISEIGGVRKLDMRHLKLGAYILRVRTEKNTFTSKIIKR